MPKIAVAIIAACAALNLTVAVLAAATHPTINSDFMAFWSYPRFVAKNPPALLYDADAFTRFQHQLYPGFHSFYPCLYPPTLLLATTWLTWFGFATAQTIWTLTGLAALTAASLVFFKGRYRRIATVAMLASPAALLNGGIGQTAFFTTALLLAGFSALSARPLLAGLCFGLLTLKPQLGVLIPFALLGLGAWRGILSAVLTAVSLIAFSCLAFSPGLWISWAHAVPTYQADYFAAARQLNLNIMVTPAANSLVLGAPQGAAWALQTICSIAIAAATFITFRRAPTWLATAALFTAMFLAVPHAYAYDTIPLTASLAIAFEAKPPHPAFLALAALIYLAPLLLLTPASPLFLYAFPEFLLYILLLRLALDQEPSKRIFL